VSVAIWVGGSQGESGQVEQPMTATTVIVAAGAALLAIAVTLLALSISRRFRGRSQELATVVAELNTRMEGMVLELNQALERAQEEGRRNRFLRELAGSIDLDEVLARTLEAAGAVPGADAALVSIRGTEGKPLVATLGLSSEEAERQAVQGPPEGPSARSIRISYQYTPEESAADGNLIHSGLAVPVAGEDDEPIGYLIVFSRSRSKTFDDDDVRELEELAVRAGPAIENARRFREARQLADLDALTGLHNRRYFHETLAREVARAHRYDRRLALLVLDLDDFKAINDRIGHLAGDAVLAEAAERARDVVRSADIACRVGGDEFAVILPESTLADADQLYRRLLNAFASRPSVQAGSLSISAGVAELRPEDDAVSFFQRSDQALYQAKEAGKGHVVAATDTG
jgi:diguanylate cyclase (GGDEF)-like protein